MNASEDQEKPLILLDVDGVTRFSATFARPGCPVPADMEPGEIPAGFNGETATVYTRPPIGSLLSALAQETGAELAWATRWNDDANRCIAPLLGLPELLVLPTVGGRLKASDIMAAIGRRPAVWFDDQPHELEMAAQIARTVGVPFRAVWVDPDECLLPIHLARARRWLAALKKLS